MYMEYDRVEEGAYFDSTEFKEHHPTLQANDRFKVKNLEFKQPFAQTRSQ